MLAELREMLGDETTDDIEDPWERHLALADTSLFVALEHDRPLRAEPPTSLIVSMITVGELRSGVLSAAVPGLTVVTL